MDSKLHKGNSKKIKKEEETYIKHGPNQDI